MMRPYNQGDLDGLCGIYSVVNAINLLLQTKLPSTFSEDLFEVVASAIPRSEYPKVLWEGMTIDRLERIAKRACGHLVGVTVSVERPFSARRFRHRDQFFDAIDAIWQESYSAFILGIDWANGGGHWTVLEEIADDHLRLHDSGHQVRLPLQGLRIGGNTGHRIVPRQTVMFTLQAVEGEPVD